jgi:hypothetical protein
VQLKFITFVALAILLGHPILAQQGIRGTVEWVEGNQMPGPDKAAGAAKGIKRTLWIYEVVSLEQVRQEGVFFSNIPAKLIKKAESTKKGKFCVKLPPGQYSLFIEEESGLYANRFDQFGQINVIEVKPRVYTTVTVVVDYQAAY